MTGTTLSKNMNVTSSFEAALAPPTAELLSPDWSISKIPPYSNFRRGVWVCCHQSSAFFVYIESDYNRWTSPFSYNYKNADTHFKTEPIRKWKKTKKLEWRRRKTKSWNCGGCHRGRPRPVLSALQSLLHKPCDETTPKSEFINPEGFDFTVYSIIFFNFLQDLISKLRGISPIIPC